MFDAGQDVVVTFDGEEYAGEVIYHKNGWVLAQVLIDPLVDHGSLTARLCPVSEVMVRESSVRPVE